MLASAELNLTHRMMVLMLELAAIIVVAKIMGEVFERALKQPAVLGELAAGLLIGPFALGGIPLPGLGHALFPLELAARPLPVSPELWGVAQLASIVLLFIVGLETDFKLFLKYSFPGFLVGMGGVAGAFVLGDLLTVWFGYAKSFMDPKALFMGTISVATSVGITARVLSEKRKLDTPEGTTILAGAVIDDVLGIIVLAIVGMLAASTGGTLDWGTVGMAAAKAFGFWLGATALFVALASTISRGLGLFKADGAAPSVALGIALLLAGVAEQVGLAMIIGAYIVGLGLSKERIAHELIAALRPVYYVLVPAFFCVMGMIVDFSVMRQALGFGIVYTIVAIVAKIVGCGLPTYLVGFNTTGAIRVGLGMLPRGEVALIVAGAGISGGLIQSDMFGVAILMTIVTTVAAPPLIVASFARGGSGLRKRAAPAVPAAPAAVARERYVAIEAPDTRVRELVRRAIMRTFEDEGFDVSEIGGEPPIVAMRKGESTIDMHEEAGRLLIDCTVYGEHHALPTIQEGLDRARAAVAEAKIQVLESSDGVEKTYVPAGHVPPPPAPEPAPDRASRS
jgi:Kef-type K+ transport system membrane component KefB